MFSKNCLQRLVICLNGDEVSSIQVLLKTFASIDNAQAFLSYLGIVLLSDGE